ncbi:MAG: hypothetical protein HN413_18490 [Chloroflexi bacterium]|nr:hypothetical protein [Chloroflexota bacterium]
MYTYDAKELYSDFFSEATALMESLDNYHAFLDGNKRTGIVRWLCHCSTMASPSRSATSKGLNLPYKWRNPR